MGGNILINIENAPTKEEYMRAQKAFINKSYKSLKTGGYFIMDNYRNPNPGEFYESFDKPRESKYNIESLDVSVIITNLLSNYDRYTQVWTGENCIKVEDNQSNTLATHQGKRLKYIPRLDEQSKWIEDAGFNIIDRWSDYNRSPIEKESFRVIHYAMKP